MTLAVIENGQGRFLFHFLRPVQHYIHTLLFMCKPSCEGVDASPGESKYTQLPFHSQREDEISNYLAHYLVEL